MSTYIIGETAWHHQGDAKFMATLIDEIANASCDAIKFHITLNLNQCFQDQHPLLKELSPYTFTQPMWTQWIDQALSKNLDVIALCNDNTSITFINATYPDLNGIELHANAINDFFLLDECAKFKHTLYLGIGGCTFDEIQTAVTYLEKHQKKDVILMYGFQNYPTDYSAINLNKIKLLQNTFNLPIGYADHTAWNDTNNALISSLAIAHGCSILEKHVTHVAGKKRIDWHAAIGKETILEIRRLSNIIQKAFGSGKLTLSESELAYGKVGPMKKAIVANQTIQKGTVITKNMLTYKRTESTSMIAQHQLNTIIGTTSNRDINADEMISEDMISNQEKTTVATFTHINKK